VVAGGEPRSVAFELTPDGHELLVLLSNGDLLVLDAETGRLEQTVPGLIEPVTNHENHGQYHPGIAAGLGRIYVSDPAGERVVELDAHDLETLRTFHLHGLPTKLALLGVLEDDSDHDHDHDVE